MLTGLCVHFGNKYLEMPVKTLEKFTAVIYWIMLTCTSHSSLIPFLKKERKVCVGLLFGHYLWAGSNEYVICNCHSHTAVWQTFLMSPTCWFSWRACFCMNFLLFSGEFTGTSPFFQKSVYCRYVGRKNLKISCICFL